MPLDNQSVKVFDEVLEYYNWPETVDFGVLDKMQDKDNFNEKNYKQAVACYLDWCVNVYPGVDPKNQSEFKLAIAQQALNILHAHAPNHHIHKALSEL